MLQMWLRSKWRYLLGRMLEILLRSLSLSIGKDYLTGNLIISQISNTSWHLATSPFTLSLEILESPSGEALYLTVRLDELTV